MWHLQVAGSSAIEQKTKQTSKQQRKVIRSQGSREYRSLSAPPVGRKAGSGAAWCISPQREQACHPCSPFPLPRLTASLLLPATLHPSFPVHAASPRFMSVYVVASHSSVLSCLKAEKANPHTSSQAASCDSAYVLNMYCVYLVFPMTWGSGSKGTSWHWLTKEQVLEK